MGVTLPSLDKRNLRESFFELLKDFSTFPASQNLFLVKLSPPAKRKSAIPDILTDENQKELGITPGTKPLGINKSKSVYERYIDGNEYMYLARGVDLTTEKVAVKSEGRLINGLLPVGPFVGEKQYPDTDLEIQFSETNISFVDTIIRPWVQMYSVHGNFDDIDLTTTITVYFIAKEQLTTRKTMSSVLFGSSGGSPVVRKYYVYNDCIPYNIMTANVSEYSSDTVIGGAGTRWRFSTYDVITPIDGKL